MIHEGHLLELVLASAYPNHESQNPFAIIVEMWQNLPGQRLGEQFLEELIKVMLNNDRKIFKMIIGLLTG